MAFFKVHRNEAGTTGAFIVTSNGRYLRHANILGNAPSVPQVGETVNDAQGQSQTVTAVFCPKYELASAGVIDESNSLISANGDVFSLSVAIDTVADAALVGGTPCG